MGQLANGDLANGYLANICRGTFSQHFLLSYICMYIVIFLSLCMLCQYYVLFVDVANIGLYLDRKLAK